MRFHVKQKAICFGDDFYLYDDNQKPLVFVDGRAFSFRNRLDLKSMEGQQLGFIRENMFAVREKYSFYVNDSLHTRVVKRLNLINKDFLMLVEGERECKIAGKYGLHDYRFVRDGEEIGRVSKDFFSWADGYTITVHKVKDALPVVATTIIIDQVLYEGTRSRGYSKSV